MKKKDGVDDISSLRMPPGLMGTRDDILKVQEVIPPSVRKKRTSFHKQRSRARKDLRHIW